MRRRHRDRSVADEGDHGGRGGQDGAGRGRMRLERGRRRHQRVRAGHAQRHHLHDRRRRADPGRRDWAPGALVRPDHRQPARGRDGAGRWLAGAGQCQRERGSVLGDPRRRGQLRRRDRIHVPAPSGVQRAGRTDVLAARAGRRRPARLPRVHARSGARAERLLRVSDGAAGAAVPGGTARPPGRAESCGATPAQRKMPPRRWSRCWRWAHR